MLTPRLSLVLLALATGTPAAAQTLLLREPTVSERHIAFAYANNIWIVDRAGGDARRLTSFQGQTSNPQLSPDGRWVAFSGQYGGNTDVYLVPVGGGEPKRLTWHPAPDLVTGWTPDGRSVVLTTGRASAPNPGVTQFWTVSIDGGAERSMPIPRGAEGEHSPDGKRFAYLMTNFWDPEWRSYRGGQNRPIWILDLASYDLETPAWSGSRDVDPVWVGSKVYFLSDRDWLMNVWSYDSGTKQLEQVTRFTDYDIKTMDAGGGAIVFEQAGRIHLLDPATGRHAPVDITVRGDFPWLTPQWKAVDRLIFNAAVSPTGKRVAFEARGDIFTVPAEKGDWRNHTATSGVAERNPAWSPDGKWLSWFSDESGEYRLMIGAADGSGTPRAITLPNPTFQFTPAWSPDSKKLLFTDTGLRLWVVDIESGRATHADTDTYMVPERSMNPVWSPDSRWIAYAKRLDSQFHAIYLYDVANGRVHQLTDGMADAIWPAWDPEGKYLYFLASTNFGLNTSWLEMESYERPVTRAVYLAVLEKGKPSPLLPESDEEAVKAADTTKAKPDSTTAKPGAASGVTVTIDFDGLADRIVAVNLAPRDYSMLRAGAGGNLFFLENVPATGPNPGPGAGNVLHRYQLKERKAATFLTGVQAYLLSQDGKKLLYRGPGQAGGWSLVDADKGPPQAGSGRLATAGMRALVDPKAEFKQMFDEGWRFQRDFLYVPNMHGADYTRTKAMYAPFIDHVRHRADLVYLQDVLGGEVAVGHSFVFAGDLPDVPQANTGLLGADFEIADNRYRISKILSGESWNPQVRAPLAQPGIDVAVGDYLLAVNGAELLATDNLYRLLESTAGRQTVLTVNGRPTLDGARRVTVVPVPNEAQLRVFDWVEGNRRKVDQLSGGKLAYIYLPNTGGGGYTFFNRYYFAQQGKPGAILDERFNGGGSVADYIVDLVSRDLHGYFNNPVGDRRPFTTPAAGIWGPKVMLINESAGSGGDMLPYMFRRMKIGPLIGTKTWGGLVGIWDTPPLIDGGAMLAPRGGFFDLDGNWAVENEGVAPDIEVEMTPKDVIAGRDPQLERGVREAMRLLAEQPVVFKPEPKPPVRSRRPGNR
ncbi:MAG: PDZ domain-containing protein [Gemmatimonadales bacterium]